MSYLLTRTNCESLHTTQNIDNYLKKLCDVLVIEFFFKNEINFEFSNIHGCVYLKLFLKNHFYHFKSDIVIDFLQNYFVKLKKHFYP
jgi:hypothetical protein